MVCVSGEKEAVINLYSRGVAELEKGISVVVDADGEGEGKKGRKEGGGRGW